jgi:mannose-6-phosphate isomerase-like protein (cupin superfamily)
MLAAGDEFTNPATGTRLRVLDAGADSFTYERVLPPGTGDAGPHVHLDFDESFEIVAGTARATLGGAERHISAGERFQVPRGTWHENPYNPGGDEVMVRGRFDPVTPLARTYVATYGQLLREGRLNDQDELKPLQLFAILRATRARSFGKGPPIALQRAMLPLLGGLGRLLGTRPVTDA